MWLFLYHSKLIAFVYSLLLLSCPKCFDCLCLFQYRYWLILIKLCLMLQHSLTFDSSLIHTSPVNLPHSSRTPPLHHPPPPQVPRLPYICSSNSCVKQVTIGTNTTTTTTTTTNSNTHTHTHTYTTVIHALWYTHTHTHTHTEWHWHTTPEMWHRKTNTATTNKQKMLINKTNETSMRALRWFSTAFLHIAWLRKSPLLNQSAAIFLCRIISIPLENTDCDFTFIKLFVYE